MAVLDPANVTCVSPPVGSDEQVDNTRILVSEGELRFVWDLVNGKPQEPSQELCELVKQYRATVYSQ